LQSKISWSQVRQSEDARRCLHRARRSGGGQRPILSPQPNHQTHSSIHKNLSVRVLTSGSPGSGISLYALGRPIRVLPIAASICKYHEQLGSNSDTKEYNTFRLRST